MKSCYKRSDVQEKYQKAIEKNSMVIVYDIETTGLHSEYNHIIQLSAQKCFSTDDGFSPVEEQCWYINPGYALPENIVKLTGITDNYLSDKPYEFEVIDEIVSFFSTEAVCGYCNNGFDNVFMGNMFKRYGYSFSPAESIDIYFVAKDIISVMDIENYKLKTVAAFYGFDMQHAHNAEDDCKTTLLCANKFVEQYKAKKTTPTPVETLIRCTVKKVTSWKNPKSWKQKRIYVETDSATFYLDILKKTWFIKGNNDQISRYNMEDIIFQTLLLTYCANEEELFKFEGRVAVPLNA